MSTAITIAPAIAQPDLVDAARLMRAYVAALAVDLTYQGIEAELADLPDKYAPPTGGLWLARDGQGRAVGCGALRGLPQSGTAELKRLYVDPAARGLGLGPALVAEIEKEARRLGYRRIVLDTLPSMVAAQALYAKLGFVDIAPYYETPVVGTRFMEKRLDVTAT
jgi:ribosomal protein S18 acetylase RimI-like enzyme